MAQCPSCQLVPRQDHLYCVFCGEPFYRAELVCSDVYIVDGAVQLELRIHNQGTQTLGLKEIRLDGIRVWEFNPESKEDKYEPGPAKLRSLSISPPPKQGSKKLSLTCWVGGCVVELLPAGTIVNIFPPPAAQVALPEKSSSVGPTRGYRVTIEVNLLNKSAITLERYEVHYDREQILAADFDTPVRLCEENPSAEFQVRLPAVLGPAEAPGKKS